MKCNIKEPNCTNKIKKKLSFVHFDVFRAQTDSFCKCHCKVPALTFFDRGIVQRFDFNDKVPG